MRWRTKAILAVVLTCCISVAVVPFALFEIGALIDRNLLDFYDVALPRTPPTGSVEPISLDEYDKNVLLKELRYCSLFPDSVASGKASMVFFSEPLYEGSEYKRGQVFLEWEMPDQVFSSEEKRLMELVGPNGKNPAWSKNLFPFLSCVAQYNYESRFEYALVDGESFTIRYVSFYAVGKIDYLLFPQEFAPKKLLKNSDIKDRADHSGRFSIYY